MQNCSTGNKDEFTPSVKAYGFATRSPLCR